MGNQESNYTKNRVNKKSLVSIIAIALCGVLAVGIVAAYFSDSVSQSGNVSTGTLDIEGTYTFFLNGVAKELNEIQNLSPGDILVVKGSISNVGNKSAWIRDKIVFTDAELFLPNIQIFEGEFSRSVIEAGEASAFLLAVTNGAAVTANKVINGTGTGAEIESGGSFNYLNASSYQVSFTIYFLPTAGNETQGLAFSLSVGAQALQFVNNNESQPNESAWSTVV